MGVCARRVILEPDAQQTCNLQTTEILQQLKEIGRTGGARLRVSATALLSPLTDCTPSRNRTSMGRPPMASGRRSAGDRGRMKLCCKLRAGKRLECEGWALLELCRCAAAQEGAGICRRKGLEAAGHVALELIAGNDLRRLKDYRRVGIAQPHDIEERVALFRIPQRSGIAELILIEPRGPKAKASAQAHAGQNYNRRMAALMADISHMPWLSEHLVCTIIADPRVRQDR